MLTTHVTMRGSHCDSIHHIAEGRTIISLSQGERRSNQATTARTNNHRVQTEAIVAAQLYRTSLEYDNHQLQATTVVITARRLYHQGQVNCSCYMSHQIQVNNGGDQGVSATARARQLQWHLPPCGNRTLHKGELPEL